ncbi:MAG: RidA family protein [Imperialibacter sp.]|uniref:RidA family protein n=1 Tax=Imperialibacter sp. TaxID=2038411 RepID=UPI0032ECA575
MKKIVYTKSAPAPIGPYSQAVRYGNLVLVSGQVAINPATGQFESGDIKSQTKLVMENLKAILSEEGLSFAEVLKCSIFIKDMNDFPVINEIYGGYFKSEPPARETVEVARLPKDALVEISLIAGIDA